MWRNLSGLILVKLKHMKETEKSYIAGHFDGEGCVRFRLKDKHRNFRTPCLQLQITHLPTLEMYKTLFGGNIYEAKNKIGKPMFKWLLTNFNDILYFVNSIAPFSMEKKEQLELVKKWVIKRKEFKKTEKLPDSFISFTDDLHITCTLLKG